MKKDITRILSEQLIKDLSVAPFTEEAADMLLNTVPEVLVKPGVKIIQKFTPVKAIKQFDMSKLVRGADAYDSTEEYEFEAWCNDAQKLGLVNAYVYHPAPFKLSPRQTVKKYVQLKTKQKVVDAFLFHPHEYTPDFLLELSDVGRKFLNSKDLLHTPYLGKMYIDVKGGFSIYHDDKQFSINQKWVFEKFKVYIYKVIPKKWFAKTWAPRAALYSPKKGKLRDCYRGTETFDSIKEKLDATAK